MIKVRAGGHEFLSELFVFDKDGLLFKSLNFWKGLAESRLKALEALTFTDLIFDWAKLMGVELGGSPGDICVTRVNATGCLAIASISEEISSTTGYLALKAGLPWVEARETSREIISLADSFFDLEASLEPQKGFPEIFRRLREANIKYGIATSDTKERAERSIELYDDPSQLAFIVTPEDVKYGKPNAEMISYISKITGVQPRNITVVGDSYVDALMAKNAGAVGVGIPEDQIMAEQIERYTDIILSSLDEILLG